MAYPRFHGCPGARPGGGSAKKKGGQDAQGLGRSRGGFSSKIHAAVDGLGNPTSFAVTGGERHDVTEAETLLDGKRPKAVIADKGFDSDAFIKAIVEAGADAVIPPRANRKDQRTYDKDLYKERNRVERFFSKLKHYRRVATRDKLLANFIGAIKLAAIHIWLR